MKLLDIFRNWTLPISMSIGIGSYFLLANADIAKPFHPMLLSALDLLQPVLIFSMLFISFCKVRPSQIRLSAWQWKILAIQCGTFLLMGGILALMPQAEWRILVEACMLCFICPAATAAIVVTGKLGGNTGTVTSYTILGNLSAAVLVPLMIPIINPQNNVPFGENFLQIIGRIFPLLFCPFFCAMCLQKIWPRAVDCIVRIKDLAFYIWAFALAIAMGITTKSLVHSPYPLVYELGIALVSLLACFLQFYAGKKIGAKYGESLSAAQSAGQKNTIFAIWMGYTFLTPVTSLAGGFYSIWHNIYNSYQLYQKQKSQRYK